MDRFKAKTGLSRAYPISDTAFLEATGKRPPYQQTRPDGSEALYAVCPACDNPIQIIGLFKNTPEAGRRPYGRHHSRTVPRLAVYDEQEYLDCPYSDPNHHTAGRYRRPQSKIAQQTLTLLREQFDRVIYFLSKEMGLSISRATAAAMLKAYLANEGWRYRVATLYNLPWVFGEVSPALPLFGRKILRGSALHLALAEGCPDVRFAGAPDGRYLQVKNAEGAYLDIYYVFLAHRWHRDSTKQDGERLEETIDFWVYRGSAPDIRTIFRKTILIQPERFLDLIHTPPEQAHRDPVLLAMAEEMIPR